MSGRKVRESPLLILCLALVFLPSCGEKDTCTCPEAPWVLRVNPDRTGPFPTIQAAIDSAASGAIVELDDGIYSGPGNRDITYRGKSITVRSRSGSPDKCIINCGGSEDDSHRGFHFDSDEGPDCILEGVTISGGVAVQWLETTPWGGGVLCEFRASPTIRNCVFANNWARSGGAVACGWYASPTLINCTLVGNRASLGSGVFSEAWSSPRLLNCIVVFGVDDAAVHCAWTGAVLISACCVFGNAGGDFVGCIEEQGQHLENFSQDPEFCNVDGGDYHLQVGSPCSPDSNYFGLIGALPVGCR